MARAGIWVDCEILENNEYDLCIYAVDRRLIMKDNLKPSQPGTTLLIVDTIIPTIKCKLEAESTAKIKGILVYDHLKNEKQER